MINVTELKQKLDQNENSLVLDVRSAEDFVGIMGHIPGAQNIPLEQLAERYSEIMDYMEKPVAIICTTDRRSNKASQLLTRKGFADVHVVKGGMTDWNQQGYTTTNQAIP